MGKYSAVVFQLDQRHRSDNFYLIAWQMNQKKNMVDFFINHSIFTLFQNDFVDNFSRGAILSSTART